MRLADLPDWLTQRIVEDPVHGCWRWVGSRYANGYGRVWDKRTGTKRGAHRVVHEVVHGVTLARTQIVDHTCGRITCVRHTEVVSNAENIRRAYTRPGGPSVRQQQRALRDDPTVQCGPPHLPSDPADPMIQMNVRIPTSLRAALVAAAATRGVTVRQATRDAFTAWVESPDVLAHTLLGSPHGPGHTPTAADPPPGERQAPH